MAKYTHKVSGARVEVRDDKVMDSSWEKAGDSEKAPAKKTAASRSSSTKSE